MMSTVASTIAAFNIPNIEILKSLGYEVDVAANFNDNNHYSSERTAKFIEQLDSMNVRHFQIDCSRSVTNVTSIVKAFHEVEELMEENHYEFVHCHTPVASVIARLAAHKTGTKVVYTAHGFHFMKGAPLKNWLVFYPIEKYFSRYTDVLITINHEDYERAMKKFHAKKVEYVPGVGVDTQKFSSSLFTEEEKNAVRSEFGIGKDSIWLLSVGELNENKNHETVIKALGSIHEKNPGPDFYYTIAGVGNKKEELEALAKEFGIGERVKLLGFRKDVSKLCESADIFVMPSHREGLSVALMEAMASSLPCAVSRIRGNTDLIDEDGGRLFDSCSVEECKMAIIELCSMNHEQRKVCGLYNRNKMRLFDKETVVQSMKRIYLEIKDIK